MRPLQSTMSLPLSSWKRMHTLMADAGATSDNSNTQSSILDLLAAVQIYRDKNEALEALCKINHAIVQQVLEQNDEEASTLTQLWDLLVPTDN